MRKLLVYLKEYKKESFLAPLFKMLEACFELFVPIVVAEIIDKGIGGNNKGIIFKMGLLLFVLAAIGLTCSLVAQYFSAKAAVGFSTKVRHAVFKHIESLSYNEIDKVGTSTLITRMTSDINQVQNGVNMFLRLFLRSPFIVFGAMIMAFTVDVKSALVFVVTIPLLSVIVFAIILYTIPMYKKVQSALDRVLSKTRENLTGVRVIRAFNKQNEETEEFLLKNQTLTNLQMLVGKISALMNPLTFIVINVATLVIIWVGAIRVDKGMLTTGAVIALVNYMSQILVELVKLANLIITLTKAIACGNRIQSVLDIEPSIDEGDIESRKNGILTPIDNMDEPYAVEFDDAGVKYADASKEAISHISFKVKKGSVVGIIGGTGSGKSSVVNLIPRFYDVSSGQVKVNGKDVREYDVTQLRDSIGIVPQKPVLFKGTIRENIKWGRADATDEEIYVALDVAQATEFVNQKEGGLDFNIEQNGRNLSGGQKQRLTIARAVVRKPQILILDDSSSALDFATDAKLRNAIKNIENRDMTVFIVSQRASSIMHSDLIVVLDDGNIAGIGKHEELLENCSIYKEIYDSQIKSK